MSLQRKKVHETYHKKTKQQYKIIDENNFTYKHLISGINQYLKPGMKVLDIGCGAGTLDYYFSSKGFNITGVDISTHAIDSCIESSQNLELKNIEFKVLDFPDETLNSKFDFIILTEVIEHLEHDILAIKNIYNMLNPEGILFLTTPSIDAPLHKLGLAKKFDQEVGHLRRYNKKEMSENIMNAGFKILEVKKNEGIVRNFLFVNPTAGKTIRYINKISILSSLVTFIDNISSKIFGSSNIFIIAKK